MARYKRLSKRNREIEKFQSDMDWEGEATLWFDPKSMTVGTLPTHLFTAKVVSYRPMRRAGWWRGEFIGPQLGWLWFFHVGPDFTGFVHAKRAPLKVQFDPAEQGVTWWTCEVCGRKHRSEFSRTCGVCTSMLESGDLELPEV